MRLLAFIYTKEAHGALSLRGDNNSYLGIPGVGLMRRLIASALLALVIGGTAHAYGATVKVYPNARWLHIDTRDWVCEVWVPDVVAGDPFLLYRVFRNSRDAAYKRCVFEADHWRQP